MEEFPSNVTELSNNYDYIIDNNNNNNNNNSFNISTNTNYNQLNLPYTVCEILVAICAVFGNGLVIIVFGKEKKLRRRTNYYIISLATADLLVGLFAIPFAILASIGLPTNLHACLFTVSVLVVLCTISIFCLVAVSVDRYWAILHPMGYSRTVRTKTAIGIICVCWITGTLVGFLPLLGWNAGKKSDEKCIFTQVMDYDYLVFLYFATIIFPALLIVAFYALIYRVVIKQDKSPFLDSGVKMQRRTSKDPTKSRSRLLDGKTRSTGCFQLQQIVTMNPGRRTGGGSISGLAGCTTSSIRAGTGAGGAGDAGGAGIGAGAGSNHHTTGTMQRFKRDVKATQNLSHIVIFFIICWFPLYTINCVMAFCPQCQVNEFFMNLCIILSHLNSVGNPLLYAYHLKDFREALKNYWRLLFSNGEVKSSVPNVMHERGGSFAGSQRQYQRQSFAGTLPIGRQRSSLLRQVTDFQAKEMSSLSRASSIRDKKQRDEIPSNSSSPSETKRRIIGTEYPLNDESSLSSANEKNYSEHSESVGGGGDTPSIDSLPMELQIYKKELMNVVPTSAEVDRSDHSEEHPPTSIFIIEADVNRTVSNRNKCEEDSYERQDERG
ncbi:PREDICTED: 5-hydroxytryptamine receptor 1D-like [Polistes dominula]|uniref:5-hydroxytryptamine receptor 1D-like n=1 Tax=Polistes dominula TaxID=743375 RepID=A0ABM1I2D8_POLDO|nr:PREDICTED: 5-hydroxytryptamine receptor 1D-like [Polistes dominula]